MLVFNSTCPPSIYPPERSSQFRGANTVTQQWGGGGGLKERYGTGTDVINSPWISQCHRNRKEGAHVLSSSEEIAFNGMFCMCPGIHSTLVQKTPGGKSRTDSACPGYPVQDHRLWICHDTIRLVRYPHRLGCIS